MVADELGRASRGAAMRTVLVTGPDQVEMVEEQDPVAGPRDLPFEVAALNEPMAVARHAVNRTSPTSGDQVVVFGAGPIGLGAAIGYKSAGAGSVVVVDLLPARPK